MKRKLWLRIAVGVSVPLVVLLGGLVLFTGRNPFVCVVYQLTGIYCTGCGAGRAAYALLHFRLLEAVDYNVLFVLFAPFIAYYLITRYLNFIIGKEFFPSLKIGYKLGWTLIIVIVAFTVLRNIPLFPFDKLAP